MVITPEMSFTGLICANTHIVTKNFYKQNSNINQIKKRELLFF